MLFAAGKFKGVALSGGLHAHLLQKDIEKKVNLMELSQDTHTKNFNCPNLMPYPCSYFYFDTNFGDRLYSKEKRSGSPLLF